MTDYDVVVDGLDVSGVIDSVRFQALSSGLTALSTGFRQLALQIFEPCENDFFVVDLYILVIVAAENRYCGLVAKIVEEQWEEAYGELATITHKSIKKLHLRRRFSLVSPCVAST